MNHKALLTTVCLVPLIAMAQVTDHPVNFQDIDQASLKVTFPRNTTVRIKVENVNRFLNKLTTEKTETDFHMTVPSVLSAVKLPGFLTTELPDPSAGAPASVPYDKTKSQSAAAWKDEIIKNVKALIDIQKYLNRAIDMHNLVISQSTNCVKKGQEIIEEVQTTIVNVVGGQ